jgi:hypothetical protein
MWLYSPVGVTRTAKCGDDLGVSAVRSFLLVQTSRKRKPFAKNLSQGFEVVFAIRQLFLRSAVVSPSFRPPGEKKPAASPNWMMFLASASGLIVSGRGQLAPLNRQEAKR